MFYYFDELTSTIDEARDPKYGPGDVVAAEYQSAGRGQRGKRWSGAAGESLLFSVVLDSSFLRVDEQFAVLQSVALALVDTFRDYGLGAKIKWPNDIYIGDRKVVGVLIDHTLGPGGMLSRSGAGIGINVNQRTFDDWIPNPTSMALEAGREFDRRELLERFHERLMSRFGSLRKGEGRESLRRDYHEAIYRLDRESRFALPDGTEFTGTIRGVDAGGELVIETKSGKTTSGETTSGETTSDKKKFLFHEISLII
jgi:BirA family biotin operon repressor/biotin-[acetyl-CoA-carboxylase] ligase